MGVYNVTISKNQQAASSSIKEDDNKDNTTKVEEIPHDQTKDQKEEKTIVLDGPLSHIFTQALNVVYANEAVNMLTQMAVDSDEKYNEDNISNSNKELYVYCCDGDNLNSDELANAANKLRLALDNKNYKRIVVSVECSNTNNKIALLDEYSSSLGIDVIYSKSRTIETIKDSLGK